MSTFHTFLQKGLVFLFSLCLMFVSVYVPQQHLNNVPSAEAGLDATEPTQIRNEIQLLAVNAWTYATSIAAIALELKESWLDGIAWAFAKGVIATMTRSIVRWINSGFQGSPAFVQDLQAHLLRVGDMIFNEFVHEIGAAPYVCGPFRLNLQIALSTSYQHYNRAGYPRGTPRCTISGVMANLENFVNGAFTSDGWDQWFRVTTQPNVYTPYGSFLTLRGEAALRIGSTQHNAGAILNYGDGFMSNVVCSTISAVGFDKERCLVSTPGHVISETLTHHLGAGLESWIAADEINEIIGSLLGQLANRALSGAAGLLGLSGGTGYTDTSYAGFDPLNQRPFVEQLVFEQEGTSSSTLIAEATRMVQAATAMEQEYLDVANDYKAVLMFRNTPASIAAAAHITNSIENPNFPGSPAYNLARINALVDGVNNETISYEHAIQEFNTLNLHTSNDLSLKEGEWNLLLRDLISDQIAREGGVGATSNIADLNQVQLLVNSGRNREAVKLFSTLIPFLN